MGASNIIRVLITGDAKNVSEALTKTEGELKSVGKTSDGMGSKLAKFGKAAAAGFAIAALAAAAFAVKSGDQLSEAQDQLSLSLKNSHQRVVDLTKSISPLQKTMEKYGFTNREVDESLTSFTRSGVKLKDAIKDEAIAADLAKSKHIDLLTATNLVSKASEGQIKGLKALAIDLPVAAGGALKLKTANDTLAAAEKKLKIAQDAKIESLAKANALLDKSNFHNLTGAKLVAARAKAEERGATMLDAADARIAAASGAVKVAQGKVNDAQSAGHKILGALASRMKGSAEESTKSLAGKTAALKAQFTDMAAKVGMKLIPVVLKLVNSIVGAITWFTKHRAVTIALVGTVGTLTAALMAYGVAMKAREVWDKLWLVGTKLVTGAQWLLNAALNANPITLVVIAIVALAAGFFLAYKKIGFFHTAVDKAWQLLQSGFHWVAAHWPLLLVILTGPIGLAIDIIVKHFQSIKDAASSLVAVLRGIWSRVYADLIAPFATAAAWVIRKYVGVLTFFAGLGVKLGKAVENLASKLVHPFDVAFHLIQRLWNDTVGKLHLPGIVGNVIGKVAGFAGIKLAQGAIVSKPTLALVGEAGREMVLPLSRPARARQLIEASGVMGSGTASTPAASATITPIVQHIHAIDLQQAMRIAANEQAWASKTAGR